MSYYRICPHCGAHLDPGEVCDCAVSQVCDEARTAFPERFVGRTDLQIINEIAAVVRKADGKGDTVDQYQRLTPENQDKFDMMVDKLLEEQEAPAGAANTDGGRVEQNLTAVSASNNT